MTLFGAFWVNPEGKFIRISGDHRDALEVLEGHRDIDRAFAEGWVRVNVGTALWMQSDAASLETLKFDILQKTGDLREVIIDTVFGDRFISISTTPVELRDVPVEELAAHALRLRTVSAFRRPGHVHVVGYRRRA